MVSRSKISGGRREAILKVCPEWKAQQGIMWAEVLDENGRRKDRFKIRDLFAP